MKNIFKSGSLFAFAIFLFSNFISTTEVKSDYSSSYKVSQDDSFRATSARPLESIDYYTNSFGEKVQAPTDYTSKPLGATAICRDGSYSFSKNRRGTCSRHGGVENWY